MMQVLGTCKVGSSLLALIGSLPSYVRNQFSTSIFQQSIAYIERRMRASGKIDGSGKWFSDPGRHTWVRLYKEPALARSS